MLKEFIRGRKIMQKNFLSQGVLLQIWSKSPDDATSNVLFNGLHSSTYRMSALLITQKTKLPDIDEFFLTF